MAEEETPVWVKIFYSIVLPWLEKDEAFRKSVEKGKKDAFYNQLRKYYKKDLAKARKEKMKEYKKNMKLFKEGKLAKKPRKPRKLGRYTKNAFMNQGYRRFWELATDKFNPIKQRIDLMYAKHNERRIAKETDKRRIWKLSHVPENLRVYPKVMKNPRWKDEYYVVRKGNGQFRKGGFFKKSVVDDVWFREQERLGKV